MDAAVPLPFGDVMLDSESAEIFSRDSAIVDGAEVFGSKRLLFPWCVHGGMNGFGAWTHPCCTTDPNVSALRSCRVD